MILLLLIWIKLFCCVIIYFQRKSLGLRFLRILFFSGIYDVVFLNNECIVGDTD